MASLSYPGVYIEEISSGVRPIAAASTSVAAFIGIAEKGPLQEAIKIFNFTEYQNRYGGFLNDGNFLAHAVFQFFNNGGTQCYIVRVSGANTQAANIAVNDRATAAQASLTIAAISPGFWGNRLAVVIGDGTNDPGNEFNLSVFWQEEDELVPLEKFENLSMVPGVPNYVEAVTASSKNIKVTVNLVNNNVLAGTSRGASATAFPLNVPDKTRFRINIDGDGYQEVNLLEAVDPNAAEAAIGPVRDLNTAQRIADAIQFMVRRLRKIRASTDQAAFGSFTCTPVSNVLVLTSGVRSIKSSVNIGQASDVTQDATGLLKLGKLQGGVETLGASVTRPLKNPTTGSTVIYFFVGDDTKTSADGVASKLPGSDGDSILNDTPYINAFQILNDKEDVSLIAVPGKGSYGLVAAGMSYCANRALSDCFFIGDMDVRDDTIEEAKTFRDKITPKNSYGAVYLPWLRMPDPTGISPEPILVPPSGYVAGLYAKTDAQRGVWKAPAGTAAALGGAVGLAVNFTDVQQGNLNPYNINAIRQFAGAGIVLWGARTVTSDPEWNYIPVRRMAIFLRVSIYRGIQWAVFEPNDEDLWAGLRLNIGSFMMTLFRQGAFQGEMPSKAFFVKCDGETTTQADIDLGIVNVLVGFAPLKPAEFVVVKISQMAGQSS